MNKIQIDEFYHLLRELNTTEDAVQKEAILGIASHLLTQTGDYTGLLRFLSYYGTEYILPRAAEVLKSSHTSFDRIVELGSGFCWLGRGIAQAVTTKDMPTVFVDKRQWVFTDIVADLETRNGRKRVLDAMKDGDLIVMSELLHCLNNPRKVLEPFTKWPILVIEFNSLNDDYRRSYNTQVGKFGCTPIANIRDVFPISMIISCAAEPYSMWLVKPL